MIGLDDLARLQDRVGGLHDVGEDGQALGRPPQLARARHPPAIRRGTSVRRVFSWASTSAAAGGSPWPTEPRWKSKPSRARALAGTLVARAAERLPTAPPGPRAAQRLTVAAGAWRPQLHQRAREAPGPAARARARRREERVGRGRLRPAACCATPVPRDGHPRHRPAAAPAVGRPRSTSTPPRRTLLLAHAAVECPSTRMTTVCLPGLSRVMYSLNAPSSCTSTALAVHGHRRARLGAPLDLQDVAAHVERSMMSGGGGPPRWRRLRAGVTVKREKSENAPSTLSLSTAATRQ